MSHIAPLSHVWLVITPKKVNAKPVRVPALVQTRAGGAYRVEILANQPEYGTTRIAQRKNLVRVTPKTAGAFHAACGVLVDLPGV
jgi:hypothetical protein